MNETLNVTKEMTPPIVALESMKISGTCYEDYCHQINKIVFGKAVYDGNAIYDGCGKTIYRYEDDDVRLTYTDSCFGNDRYMVEINRNIWDDLPDNINPLAVNDGGPWNIVYDYLESRSVLMFHLPGEWVNALKS